MFKYHQSAYTETQASQDVQYFVVVTAVFNYIQYHTVNRVNMNVLSYKYMDSDYKYKMVLRPSYLYNGNPYTWKGGLYIETGRWFASLTGGNHMMKYEAIVMNAVYSINYGRFLFYFILPWSYHLVIASNEPFSACGKIASYTLTIDG